MEAAVCLALAVVYLLVWLQRRDEWAHLLFVLSATAAAVVAGCEFFMMHSRTPEMYGWWVRWGHVPVWVLIAGTVWFARFRLRAGRLWLVYAVTGTRTLALVINFVCWPNLNFQAVTSMEQIRFLGEFVSVPVGVENPWSRVGQFSSLLLLAFLVDASITVWRRGERKRALFFGGNLIFFITAAAVHSAMLQAGAVRTPYLISLAFFGIILVMGYDLSRQLFHAAQTAADLRETQQHVRLAAAATELAMWNWDIEHDVIWVSREGRPLYDLSQGTEITFERFLATLHPDDRASTHQAAERALNGDGAFTTDYRVVLPGVGVRWMTAKGRAEFNSVGKPLRMRGVSLDITGRKRDELELARQRQELAHLSRVNILGELAGALAHELNQPLTAVLSNAQAGQRFLRNDPADVAEIAVILHDIADDAKRAGGVIHGMRAMFKKDAPSDMEDMEVNEAVNQVLKLLHGEIVARKAQVNLSLGVGLPPVRMGRVEIQQVLINLVMNGLDAIKSDPLQGIVEITSSRHEQSVIVAVKDGGAGIPAEIMQRLFEPFVSTKPGGLGLGLAISHNIAARFGGELLAKNLPAGGAVFQLVLPVADAG